MLRIGSGENVGTGGITVFVYLGDEVIIIVVFIVQHGLDGCNTGAADRSRRQAIIQICVCLLYTSSVCCWFLEFYPFIP